MGHSLAIRRHFESHLWIEGTDPSRPSGVWDRILTDLDACNRDVLQLFDNEGVLERREAHTGMHS